jgi:hypothetical protein
MRYLDLVVIGQLTGNGIVLQFLKVFFTGVCNVLKGICVEYVVLGEKTPFRIVIIMVVVGVLEEKPAIGHGFSTKYPAMSTSPCKHSKESYLGGPLALYWAVSMIESMLEASSMLYDSMRSRVVVKTWRFDQ